MKQNGAVELKQHSEETPGNPLLSPGAMLQEARHELGYTQAEVARRLCLTIKVIAALERDEYKELPGLSYIRGYLRTYANLLNISAEKVLHSFEQQGFVNNFLSVEKQQIKKTSSLINKKDYITKPVSYIFIFLFFSMSLWWWYEHRNTGLDIIGKIDMDLSKLNHHSNANLIANNIAMDADTAFYILPQDNMELDGDNIFGKPYLFDSTQ